MSGVKERLPMLYEICDENRQVLRNNYGDAEKDREGKYSASLIGDLRFFAVAEFVLHGHVILFCDQLSEAASIREELCCRIERGDPIDASYNSVLGYKDVLNALAAGDFNVARKLSARIVEMPVSNDVHAFDEAFGKAICALVSTQDDMAVRVSSLLVLCRSIEPDFVAYAEFFHAIQNKDTGNANDALVKVVDGHKRQSKGDGVFSSTEDEAISVWGIGVANLARHLGVEVTSPDETLIPSVLLV